MDRADLIGLFYLVAASLFILGLKGLARPRTAVRGNQLGALGMGIAVVVTLLDRSIISYWLIGLGIVVGTAIGVALATRVEMTAMPQLVAMFNGFGGLASVLVAGASFFESNDLGLVDDQVNVAAALAGLVGAVTFTGSLIAMAKLQEVFRGLQLPATGVVNTLLAVVAFVFAVLMVVQSDQQLWFWLAVATAAVLGVTATSPIGGADMPVVIALLNSMSGLAAAAAGFALDNALLIVAGALVGASGFLLTTIMTSAMNRTLGNVLFSTAPGPSGIAGDDDYDGTITSTSAEEVAMILDTADRIVIVPGYGLAVAQAQHAVRDLSRELEQRGAEVIFGIHPVAGRMPGHMNVLLAEAEIDYDALVEMDDVNPLFEQTDVVLVLGANDVVNPIAREPTGNPIAGMPILDVDRARVVVVIKRSMSPGFAGIPNPLFVAENTMMLFGDGRSAVIDITKAMAEI